MQRHRCSRRRSLPRIRDCRSPPRRTQVPKVTRTIRGTRSDAARGTEGRPKAAATVRRDADSPGPTRRRRVSGGAACRARDASSRRSAEVTRRPSRAGGRSGPQGRLEGGAELSDPPAAVGASTGPPLAASVATAAQAPRAATVGPASPRADAADASAMRASSRSTCARVRSSGDPGRNSSSDATRVPYNGPPGADAATVPRLIASSRPAAMRTRAGRRPPRRISGAAPAGGRVRPGTPWSSSVRSVVTAKAPRTAARLAAGRAIGTEGAPRSS